MIDSRRAPDGTDEPSADPPHTPLIDAADLIDHAADHLVCVVSDLAPATAELEDRLGVPFTPGGSHEGFGTRNVLLRLGPRTYLELLGPDPAQPSPASGLWASVPMRSGLSLATWCVRSSDLDGLAASHGGGATGGHLPPTGTGRTGARPPLVGPVRSMTRATPDGARLEWTLTLPVTPPVHGGLVPFFINWGDTGHPCDTLPDHGVRLQSLRGRHPDPAAARSDLGALGVQLEVRARPSHPPGLLAELSTPTGAVVVL